MQEITNTLDMQGITHTSDMQEITNTLDMQGITHNSDMQEITNTSDRLRINLKPQFRDAWNYPQT